MRGRAITVVLFTLLSSGASAQVFYQPTPAPLVTAESEAWFQNREAITWDGAIFVPSGAIRPFSETQMVRTGVFRGIPLYTDVLMPSFTVLFVPLRNGWMQPYERTAFVTAPSLQAAGPPSLATGFAGSGFVAGATGGFVTATTGGFVAANGAFVAVPGTGAAPSFGAGTPGSGAFGTGATPSAVGSNAASTPAFGSAAVGAGTIGGTATTGAPVNAAAATTPGTLPNSPAALGTTPTGPAALGTNAPATTGAVGTTGTVAGVSNATTGRVTAGTAPAGFIVMGGVAPTGAVTAVSQGAGVPLAVDTGGQASTAPVAVGTAARVAASPSRPVTTVNPPTGLNAIWIEFDGRRWYAAGDSIDYDADQLNEIGTYRGWTVYAMKGAAEPRTIYIPSRPGVLAAYTLTRRSVSR
jgi:hypothetical protein